MHACTEVVCNHFIEKAVSSAAQCAARIPTLNFKGMVFKSQAFDRCVGRHCINTFFAASTKELQGRVHVHLRVVKFRNR